MNKLSFEISWNKGRVFTCGDLHGCYEDFIAALEAVNFNYDEDIVICTGDLVDRGKSSLDCFNLIYKSWFYTVKGNHEQFCSDYFTSDKKMKHKDFHCSHGGEWFYRLPLDVKEHIAEEINNLPITITLNRNGKKYGFVHGDIPIFIRTWAELNEMIKSKSLGETVVNTCLIGRGKARLAMNATSPDYIFKYDDVDRIYLGHTVMRNHLMRGNMCFIDTGCVYKNGIYGKLTMLEVK